MADDMIGTLFESDATSLLDSEASHLLTELESMATDPGQPPPPPRPQQQNPYFDYGGGGGVPQQPMQSPVSQAIHSPAGSIHSPGGMISPSNPQHFGSPPPQQAGALQRQMSVPHQYASYPSHSMQQGTGSLPGTPTGWRSSGPQPTYPTSAGPPQSPQRGVSPGYSLPQQQQSQAQHMPPPHPSHHPQQGAPPPQYMTHPNQQHHQMQQAGPHPSQHPSQRPSTLPHDPYRHMQQHPHQIQYRQMAPSYMHQPMTPQQQMAVSRQQHMVSQQPRMPRPGMPAQYASHVMHQQRLPGPHHSMMGPPGASSMITPGSNEVAMHQQQMHSYHPQQQQHYQQMAQQHPEMLHPGHYSQLGQMRPQMSMQGPVPPYGYNQQQSMGGAAAQATQSSYSVPQSSPRFQMASSHPSQNGSSLEQLEKMVSPLNQQIPSSPMSSVTGYPGQPPAMMSPRSQQQHMAHHAQMQMAGSGGQHDMSSSVISPHMMSPQQQQHQMHMQQYGMPQQPPQHPQPKLSPLETIAKEIEMFEHKVRQMQSVPQPHYPDHEKELRTAEERLRSLNSQQSMMFADVKQAEAEKQAEKLKQKVSAAADSAQQSPGSATSQPPQLQSPTQPLSDSAAAAPPGATPAPSVPGQLGSDERSTAGTPNFLENDSEELSAALSAIVDGEDLSDPLPTDTDTQASKLENSAVTSSPVPTSSSSNNTVKNESLIVPADPATLGVQVSEATSINEPTLANNPPTSAAPIASTVADPPPPPPIGSVQPGKPTKKTKTKKTKEKTPKVSKRKAKAAAELVQPQFMQMVPHPPPQAGMGGGIPMDYMSPHLHHPGMLPASQGMQPIAPHPTSQPIMFVQSQQGAPMMIQPPSMSAQHTMPGQMMSSPGSVMSYQQPPVPTSHPSQGIPPIQPGLQPVMPSQHCQQLRAIAPRPSPQVLPHMSATHVMQNGPTTLPDVDPHLPELLEDPNFGDSDLALTIDSPAMSENSNSTPGRPKKSNKGKNSGRKGKKPGPKRPPASLLKLKKRKRKNSDSMSDNEMSPGLANTPDSDSFAQRRSGRVTKRQKYIDDLPLDISDDDGGDKQRGDNSGIVMQSQDAQEEAPVVTQYIVEKIMGLREGTRELELDDDELAAVSENQSEEGRQNHVSGDDEEKVKDKKPAQTIKVTEYYIKYKNFSYLHCDWKTQEELEVTDKRVNQKIKRWQQKQALTQPYMLNLMDEDELFNPEYVEVDRVLGESRFPPPEGSEEPESVYYLIKWRQLPYEDATWELEADVDKVMIAKYLQYVNPPDKVKRIPAPNSNQWKTIPKGLIYKGDNQLRDYQFEGVNWLTFCYYNRQNCILADEMGLGKTVQSITYLQAVLDYGIKGPFLVIAPLSTIGNWIREFDTWTDLNVIVYHGSSTSRMMIQEYDMFYKDSEGKRRMDAFKFHCLITTYEVIIQDVELLTQIEWRCCVIDEAHRLKNKNCKLMEGLRCFDLEHKVLLSGTPLQNNVEELFSLLNFLEPEQFRSSADFMAEFGNLKTEGQVDKLKAILKPMMLRRLKEDVEKNLAPKEETIIEVELTNIQKKYYRAILEKNFSFLSKGGTTANVPNLMNTMMELRKCCNHPYLINGAEEQIVHDLRERRQSVDTDILTESMIQGSGKLVLLDKLLPKLKAGNHKVLIFSQMIRVLDIIEDYLINKKYIYERIDGRIRGNQRQEAIDRFSRPDSDRFVFLLCTRAGGLGINLTAADTCVIYDSDWNPQNDLQAQARCHRIGQKKAVKIYRLICRNTYEREMFDKASLKLGLDKAVLQSMGSGNSANKGDAVNANGPAPLTKQEVEQLLKKGAYGALMEDDQAGDQFCEEDIDQILQRRTQVITIESVGKGSTFAKASFSSSGARDDIDINDPEFWQKWAKKAEVETDTGKSDLIIAEPRRRKQTKRFGGHQSAQLEEISDLDSSSDSETDDRKLAAKQLKGNRKGRGRKDDDFEIEDNVPPPGCYARPECFKVEKMLLVYGWGRWTDMVKHGGFRRELDELDVSNISQAILLHSLQHYKGDVTIKNFIWDLIMPSENGEEKDIKIQRGLAGPAPRGRKPRSRGGKKDEDDEFMDAGTPGSAVQSELSSLDEKILTCHINTEMVLSDAGYRKHLIKHSNKVLLRVRMLYYLKQEVIGAEEPKVYENVNWSLIDILSVPKCEGEPPASWWDKDSDKCLLIGAFKHGYEKYNLMRADDALLFLTVCGPPDGKALRKEQQNDDDDGDKLDDTMNDDDPATPAAVPDSSDQSPSTATKHLPFPSSSDLNTRIRRIITAYQKISRRKAEAAAAALEKRNARMERNAALRIRDLERVEKKNSKWTRREESDFYRVISSFGVESTKRGTSDEPRQYVWDTFRQLANLHKKDDDMITDYMEAFCYMCRKVCNKLTPTDEGNLPSIVVEPISEERASRCLSRIELLNKIREEVLWHDALTKRLTLCQYSPEIPMWWKPGEHDKDLLIGAAKHGLSHTDQHILYDPKLCFKDLYLKSLTEPDKPKISSSSGASHSNNKTITSAESTSQQQSSPLIEKLSTVIKEEEKEIKNSVKSSHSPTATSPHQGETETPMVNGDMSHAKSDVEEEGAERPPSSKSVKEEEQSKDNDPATEIKEASVKHEKEPEDLKPDHLTPGEECETLSITKSDTEKEKLMHSRTNGLSAYSEEITMPIVWPKDRVVYQRLELVCYCIETGEWPTAAISRRLGGVGLTTTLDTPVGTPDPSRVGTPNHSEYSCAMDDEETESLRLTISRGVTKTRKPKRSRLDLEVDRIARLRDGGESECSQSTPLRGTPDSFINGSISNIHSALASDDLMNSFIAPRKKRGRKSKAEKEAEARAAAESTIMTSYKRLVEMDIDQDMRVPMVDIKDGSRVTGEDAPLRKDLEQWMVDHPHFMPDMGDVLGSSSSSSQGALANLSSSTSTNGERRGRRPKHETSSDTVDVSTLTGSENVPVIHRETGKKITGSKAPTLMQLSAWLERNAQYDVEPRWAEVAMVILPEHLRGRIHTEKKRRRRDINDQASASSSAAAAAAASSSFAAQAAATQALMAAAMQGYPMNMGAFGSLASMGMPPSLLSMYGMGLGADPSADEETAKALAAATSAHSAFPFQMYNPMMAYSSMLAAQGLGLGSSQSYAAQAAQAAQALSTAGMFNGLMGFDHTAALAGGAGAGGDMDAEMIEKLSAMSANMGMLDDMQLRAKMYEEFYSRGASTSGLGDSSTAPATSTSGLGEPSRAPSTSTREPGETSPSISKPRRKSATITKPRTAMAVSDETAAACSEERGAEEMPEDLSMKPKGEEDSSSVALSNEGRLSRGSELADTAVDRSSECNDDKSIKLTNPVKAKPATSDNVDDGTNSPTSDGRHSRTSNRAVSLSPRPASRPPSRPASTAQSHSSNEDQTNQSVKSRPESPSSVVSRKS